jgi:hypothetical protein
MTLTDQEGIKEKILPTKAEDHLELSCCWLMIYTWMFRSENDEESLPLKSTLLHKVLQIYYY